MNTLREQLLALAENDADPQTLVFIAAQIALGEPQDYDTAGSCPICGPTLVNDGTCIRHGDIDVLWSAHYAGRRDAADAITALRAENERQAREIRTLRNVAVTADERAERAEAERDAMTAEPCKDCRTPTVCATTGCDPYHAQPAEPTAAPAQGEPQDYDALIAHLLRHANEGNYRHIPICEAADAIAALRAEHDALREVVKAADAMRDRLYKPRGDIASIEAYDAARAKVKP